jgi:repressor LexA
MKEMVDVPILGVIHAGLPTFAEENFEDTFPIPLQYIHSNKQLFMLNVAGDSMIEAGIEDGDLLIVEEAATAKSGEIVVAIMGDEATVKTFYRENNHIRLQPENSAMAPIIIEEVRIIGKPIGLFRRF